MENKKEPFLAQLSFFLSGLTMFWVGLALFYTNKDSHPILANNAKTGATLGFILYVVGAVLKIVELNIK